MVTAAAADEFESVGVAALRPTVNDAGWLAPQNHRPPSAGSSPVRTAAFVCSQLRCHGLMDVFVDVAGTDAVEDAVAR